MMIWLQLGVSIERLPRQQTNSCQKTRLTLWARRIQVILKWILKEMTTNPLPLRWTILICSSSYMIAIHTCEIPILYARVLWTWYRGIKWYWAIISAYVANSMNKVSSEQNTCLWMVLWIKFLWLLKHHFYYYLLHLYCALLIS